TLGWIALISTPVAGAGGAVDVQVAPASVLRWKCPRPSRGRPTDSVLLGATIAPSAARTGLFLIGPRMPSGSRRASLHVFPPSREERSMPHHSEGLGPTL